MLFTEEEYFAVYKDHPDITDGIKNNVRRLHFACDMLSEYVKASGIKFQINPTTKSVIAGVKNGGFRPQDCTVGAPMSSHKQGLAVDLYDPYEDIDNWCMKHQDILTNCGIYIESPTKTPHWTHWTIKPPVSGNRVFMP
jgi:hypothetical protein